MKKTFLLTALLFMSLSVEPIFAQVLVNKQASDFALVDSWGNEIKLSKFFPDKAVVLWITNLCSGCQQGLLTLERLYGIHEEKIEFLAIVQPNTDIEEVRKIRNASKVSFPFLMDYKGEVSKLYGGVEASGVCPLNNIFFIDSKGVIREISHYPGLEEKDLEKYLNLIL